MQEPESSWAILPFTKHIHKANENILMGPLSYASNDQLQR